MHCSSLKAMFDFLKSYVKPGDMILDVGSRVCENGKVNYGRLLSDNVTYTGLDIEPGKNVDIVVADQCKWDEIESDSFDVVISGQAFEHIEFFWVTFKEMARVLKPDGYMCIIAPKLQKEHKFPVDCWRFLPDGMRALAKWAGIKCISASARSFSYNEKPNDTYDCVGVFQK